MGCRSIGFFHSSSFIADVQSISTASSSFEGKRTVAIHCTRQNSRHSESNARRNGTLANLFRNRHRDCPWLELCCGHRPRIPRPFLEKRAAEDIGTTKYRRLDELSQEGGSHWESLTYDVTRSTCAFHLPTVNNNNNAGHDGRLRPRGQQVQD